MDVANYLRSPGPALRYAARSFKNAVKVIMR
jgi:hypothetical protein